MKRLNIVHQSQTVSSQWPENLQATFGNIYKLGGTEYESYEETPFDEHGQASWRQEIKTRAKELSGTTSRLKNENPSELTWRLQLEPLVDARFRHQIEC